MSSMMQSGPLISLSPSFNSYSSSKMAEIAARVVEECRVESNFTEENDDVFCSNREDHLIQKSDGNSPLDCRVEPSFTSQDAEENDAVFHHLIQNSDENSPVESNRKVEKFEENNESDSNSDDDFEFSFVTRDVDYSTISADEIFFNGQIRPTFPVFGKDSLPESMPPPRVRLPLGRFLIEERQATMPSSSSSSESDELDGVQPGTYCVWIPKRPSEKEQRPKKSNSTGSSKRWKFRELIGRSNSDGKDNFVFLMPFKR